MDIGIMRGDVEDDVDKMNISWYIWGSDGGR
jgi:hypothetical protein